MVGPLAPFIQPAPRRPEYFTTTLPPRLKSRLEGLKDFHIFMFETPPQ